MSQKRWRSYAHQPQVTPMQTTLEAILATASPFDDAFDSDLFSYGEQLEPLPIWTNCGRRIDLLARSIGLKVLGLHEVIDDAQANWSGNDDAGWESDAHLC